MEGDGSCMYRGPNDRRCAIGWLIPDALYDPFLEEIDLSLVLDKLTDNKKFEGVDKDFLRDFQLVHDENSVAVKNGKWDKNFKVVLKKLGKNYKLETKFLKKLEFK